MSRSLAAALLTALLCGAARAASAAEDYGANFSGLAPPSGYIVLFYNSSAPLSYVSLSPRDVPAGAVQLGRVRSVTCQYGVSVPTSLTLSATSVSGVAGNSSLQRALTQLRKKRPNLAGIYDVMMDQHVIQVLGVFQRVCIELTARGFALPR